MSKKATDIVCYLSPLGFIIAFLVGARQESRFHLNQSLVIWLVGTIAGIVSSVLGWIPLIGWLVALAMVVVDLFCVVCWFIGVIGAIQGTEKPVPVLGQIQLLK